MKRGIQTKAARATAVAREQDKLEVESKEHADGACSMSSTCTRRSTPKRWWNPQTDRNIKPMGKGGSSSRFDDVTAHTRLLCAGCVSAP